MTNYDRNEIISILFHCINSSAQDGLVALDRCDAQYDHIWTQKYTLPLENLVVTLLPLVIIDSISKGERTYKDWKKEIEFLGKKGSSALLKFAEVEKELLLKEDKFDSHWGIACLCTYLIAKSR